MALDEYKRKRDFRKTPEPAAGGTSRARISHNGFSYLIQKHDATRLHYDLRLELDGVLLSWAVTKGPSLNPADKRLAVRTEDHPLSYGTFEGIIPKGQYGGGTVMLWDRGSWKPKAEPHEGLRKGHLSFTLNGERLKGGWNLVRMHTRDKKENWLLIKEKDDAAQYDGNGDKLLQEASSSVATHRKMEEIAVDAPPPVNHSRPGKVLAKLMAEYQEVQLATLVDTPPSGEDWLHEIKFDGYRLLGFHAGGEVQLRTRNGNDWTRKFPSIASSLAKLRARAAVLDMEAVVLDNAGKSDFQAMQRALGEDGDSTLAQAYVFDLLYLDGEDVSREPLADRKNALRTLLKKSTRAVALRYSDHVIGHGPDFLEKSCAMGLEGIISKQSRSPYTPGRQKAWLKIKCNKRQEFVIIGYTAARKGNRAIGALHLGYRDRGSFKYAGKVGTGFGMKDARELYERLSRLKSDSSAIKDVPRNVRRDATWVQPELLCEVSFTEWTANGHVRHPSFQGLREDKKPQDVVAEEPVHVDSKPPRNHRSNKLDISGVNISHPDRVIFKENGLTKGELVEFYAECSPWILKDLSGHPVTLLRCPEGAGETCFFQRSPGKGLGGDVKTLRWTHKGKSYEYLYIEDEKGLIELAQMGAIELHPWGARVQKIDYPNRLIFDLDPAPEVPFDAVKLAALDLRRRLEANGLKSFLKCTGGKGLHVTAPLGEVNRWEEVKAFCAGIAEGMVRDIPAAYVATMSKSKRAGKIFVDYFRNDYTATAIADFSVRARPGAPVAVPLEWKELDKLHAGNQFTIKDVRARLKKRRPDLKRHELRQKLPD